MLIDGTDVREYSLKNLRDGVGMVLQNNVLFSGDIADNLRWGDGDATDEQIRQAASAAQADEFVNDFADGYATQLGQGGCNVSGGQKQRLCIARALLKKPKILILDDSTSAVDTATERKINAALEEQLAGCTTITVSQRISSIMHADVILVMDNGRVIDMGTHEQLLAGCTLYREIYDLQTNS